MNLSSRARRLLATALALTVATGASGALARGGARPAFTAVARDLNRKGRIDAIDVRGHGLRITAPIVLAASTADLTHKGHIDDIRVRLSGPPRRRGLLHAFRVAGYRIRAVRIRGDRVDLLLQPHLAYDTGARPVVTAWNLRSPNGKRAPTSKFTPADGASPALISATTAAGRGDGRLDAVNLQLSEPVIPGSRAVEVQGYQVVGLRDNPDGELTALLAEGAQPDTSNLPLVTLNGAGLRDAAGNRGPTATVRPASGAAPVMVAARDEGFWLSGERVITVWSGPVHSAGPGAAGAFSMVTSQGLPVSGQSLSAGAAPNEIAVNLPVGSETPAQVAYTGAGSTQVEDAAGHPGLPSGGPVAVAQSQPQFAGTVTDPFNQDQMIPFGERSFYLQPWRSYLDTFPAVRMLNAVGINFNVNDGDFAAVDAGARLLRDAGFARARINITWDSFQYNNPSQLTPYKLGTLTNELQQLRANGIRPLILLDANDTSPCPSQSVVLNLTAPAPAGATTVQLDSASVPLVRPGLTGFNQYGLEAGVLITSVTSGGLATLSQPLESGLAAGAQDAVDLAFQPFFPEYNSDGSANANNTATLNGWLQYVAATTRLAKSVLGSDQFDVEVWNELTFGSSFLSASNYYSPAPQGSGDTNRELLQATVNYVRNPANGLPDVGVGDGFTNEEPFTSGSTEVPGVTAMDKHPYQGAVQFPSQATYSGIAPVDALGAVDATNSNGNWYDTFVPRFIAFFPEYPLSAIQTETVTRDLSPFLSDIYGGLHGRGTHPPGAPAPQTWVTEVNLDPTTVNETLTSPDGTTRSAMSPADIRHFETKAILRYVASWVGKGVTAIDFYAAANAGDFNLIEPSFWSAADAGNGYPGLAAGGETMLAVQRFLASMAGAQQLPQTRPLTLGSVSDYGGAYQFAGNGTPAYPPLYNRDMIGFSPFQVSTHKWVIPTYVMSVNLATLYNPRAPASDVTRQDMPQEVFRLTIGGVNSAAATASATDPLTGASVPVKIVARGSGSVSLEIPLTDSPRMLTLMDG